MEALQKLPGHVPSDLVFDFNIYGDPRLTSDLHGSYESLHKDAPDIFYTPENGGHWVVTRYDDVADIVKDPEHFSVREMQIPRVPNPPVFIPLSLDPPTNIPYRQALMPFFSPKAVAKIEPRIRKFAVEIIDEIADKGECDFLWDVSSRFPVSVFMELMGLPLDKLRPFRELAENFFQAQGDASVDLEKYVGQIIQLMTELLELRKKDPQDDLATKLLAFEIEGRPITLEELQSICLLLFVGGMDTVTNASAFLYRYLATDKPLQARLREEPQIIPNFVEEGLRSFGVVNTPRLVVKDVDLKGVPFREGDMVLCLLPVAGRDDRVHGDPNAFNVDRKKFEHLTFSTGPHLCLGHTLARHEMRILTEEWVKRIPEFSLKPGVDYSARYGTVMAPDKVPLIWAVG